LSNLHFIVGLALMLLLLLGMMQQRKRNNNQDTTPQKLSKIRVRLICTRCVTIVCPELLLFLF